jgi:hypothetical protein
MTEAGKHHNSALCHIATTLLTRIIACWAMLPEGTRPAELLVIMEPTRPQATNCRTRRECQMKARPAWSRLLPAM